MVIRSFKFIVCSLLFLNLEAGLSPLSANTLMRYGRRMVPSLSAAKNQWSGRASVLGSQANYNYRFYSDDNTNGFNQQNFASQNALSKGDLEQIKALIKEDRDSLLKQIKDEGSWDLDYAQEKIIEEFEKQGMSREEAVAEFNKIDEEIDRTRAAMKSPYILGAALPAAAIPASWALVYHQPFYEWISTNWPWLTETSWDWSEPLLQSLLATETGAALMFGSLAALGYQNYSRLVNRRLVDKLVKKTNIPKETAKKFIKVDVDNRHMK